MIKKIGAIEDLLIKKGVHTEGLDDAIKTLRKARTRHYTKCNVLIETRKVIIYDGEALITSVTW